MTQKQVDSVDDYISGFPAEVRAVLARVREIVTTTAPTAVESIGYNMPAYSVASRSLVYFAGWKTHVALYAVPAFDGELEAELAPYRASKDTVKFSYRAPLPEDLVRRVVAELVVQRGE